MGATDSLAPPPGFVDDVSPPDGFVADEPSPPAGFVPDETPAREPSYPVGPPSAMAMIGALSDATTAAALQGNLYDVFTPRNPAEIVAEQNKTALQNISEGLQEPSVSIPTPEVTGPLTGALRGAANLAEGLSAPMNALLVPFLGGAPGIIKGAAGVGFGVPMAKHAISETLPAALDARSSGEAVQNLVEGIGGLAMATGALGAGRPRKDGASKTAPPRSGSEDITTDTIKAAVDSSVERILSEPVAKTAAETVIPPETPLPNVPRETLPKIETAAPVEPIIAPETKVTESPTGIRNAIVDQERVERGLSERMEPLRRTFGKLWDEAMAKADQDAQAGSKLVKSVEENPRPLEDWESALLAHEQVTRQNAFDKAVEAVNSAKDETARTEASAMLAEARNDVQQIYDVGQTAGTKSGQSLAARKLLVEEDYSLAKMEATTRAIVNEGRPLSEKQAAEVKALHDRIAETEKKLAEYEGKEAFKRLLQEQKKEATATAKTGGKVGDFLERQAEAARERIVARRGRLNVTVDPLNVAGLVDEAIIGSSYLAKGISKFADWSARMIEDFGHRIAPYLKDLFAKSRELHDANAKAFTVDPIAAQKKAIITRTEKLKAKIEAGDFEKPPKKEPLMDAEKARLLYENQKAKEQYNRGLFEAQLAKRTKPQKIFSGVREVLNTSRALLTSFDLSAVLRQGGFIALGHPIRAAKAFPSMFRALVSEKGEFTVTQGIKSRPNAQLYAQAKLYISEQGMSLNKMEEAYMSRWATKIPGVGASQRAYTTFLNRLRADSFDAMAASLSREGKVTLEEARAIGNFINVATGRGNIGGAAQAAVAMNTVFFAPRYVVSRFQILAGQPLYRGTANTRLLIAREYGRFLIGAGVVYGLAATMQDEPLETDPTSTDFLKIRFGDTRLDPMAGLIQVTTFTARELDAVKDFFARDKQKRPKYGTGADVLGRFLRTKLSPNVGAAVNVVSGKDVVGREASPASVIKSAVLPISFDDIRKAIEEQGVAKGAALGLLALFGMGLQTYEKR